MLADAHKSLQVLFYSLSPQRPAALLCTREYLGVVAALWLTSTHAAALVDGRLAVHPVAPEGGRAADEHDVMLPAPGAAQQVRLVRCFVFQCHTSCTRKVTQHPSIRRPSPAPA